MANEKFDQLINDPDFLSLPEEHQNQIVDEMRQKDFGKIPGSESFLQRAAKGASDLLSGKYTSPMQVGNKESWFLPSNDGMHNLASDLIGEAVRPLEEKSPGTGSAISAVSEIAGPMLAGSPRLPFAPKSPFLGQVGKGVKGALFKGEGEKEAFLGRLFKIMQKKYGRETAEYGKQLDKSFASVDLSDIIEDGANLTLRQAQNIKNTLSEGIPEAVKSGVKISSKYKDPGELVKIISQRMKEAEPAMAGAMERFGSKANDFKQSIGQFTRSTSGSEKIYGKPNILGFKDPFLGGSGAREATKRFAPKVFKIAQKERRLEDLRRLGQAALVGGPATYIASKAVPSIFKQASRRFTEGL